jgi:hypothetical protein
MAATAVTHGLTFVNPWDRNPSPVEAELLERAGQSRELFER